MHITELTHHTGTGTGSRNRLLTGTRERVARRVALITAALALAAAGPAAAAQAYTGSGGHAAVTAVSAAKPKAVPVLAGDPQSAVDHVGDFYGAYIDAIWDGDSGSLPADLRTHYLTTGLQKRLAAWENTNHADGVLRAQDVPQGWQVTYDGSGAGHAFTTVRLQWGNPANPDYTYLKVQSDLATRKISDIQEQ
jgi:hypothetical protein